MVIVGTLIFESLDRQVVRILIVYSPEHDLRNANLQKRRSDDSGPAVSPMLNQQKYGEEQEGN